MYSSVVKILFTPFILLYGLSFAISPHKYVDIGPKANTRE
jgi:hypothetical protein